MSRLAPLELDQIKDPELRDLITQCVKLGVPDELFPRIIARVPAQAKTLLGVMLELHTKGTVDHQLKEIIRVQLARFVDDPYFSALRSKQAMDAGLTEERIDAGCDGYEESDLFTEAERMALRFSEQLFLDPDRSTRSSMTRCVSIITTRRSWRSARSWPSIMQPICL